MRHYTRSSPVAAEGLANKALDCVQGMQVRAYKGNQQVQRR